MVIVVKTIGQLYKIKMYLTPYGTRFYYFLNDTSVLETDTHAWA